MIHRIGWLVGAQASLDFWEERLRSAAVPSDRDDGWLRFVDPEGLCLELVADGSSDAPLRAGSDDIPEEHPLLRVSGVRSLAAPPKDSAALLLGLIALTR